MNKARGSDNTDPKHYITRGLKYARHGDAWRGQGPWVDYVGNISINISQDGRSTYMVTRLAWMAAKLVSSKRETR